MDLGPRRVGNSSSAFYCWAEDPREASMHEDVFSMTVDRNMLNYFSQPGGRINPASFIAIYCSNPIGDDDCPVGICPNPDIAGVLVRIAHYITAFCLTILIFNAPKRVKDAFYYQISTIYALLITCSVSIFQANITRLHATVAITIASSPVSIYFLVYSIRAFWGEHRLNAVLGKRNYLNRGLVFLAVGIWISLVVYTSLKSTEGRFTQGSCETVTVQEVLFLQGLIGPPPVVLSALAVISWTISIALARKEIWLPGERYRPKVSTVWRTISRRFPLVFFLSIGIVPMSLWVWTIEMTLSTMKDPQHVDVYDDVLSLSFGQILALFIAVPPLLQVCQVVPQIWTWLINLSWIACCRRRKGRGEQPTPVSRPDVPEDTVHYVGLLVVPPVDQSGYSHEGMQESASGLGPNRYYGA